MKKLYLLTLEEALNGLKNGDFTSVLVLKELNQKTKKLKHS
jgi:hypothetical protein